jgi:hypothetical protein
VLPAKPVTDDPGKPRHLDPNVLDSPTEALGCALRETLNLGGLWWEHFVVRDSIVLLVLLSGSSVLLLVRQRKAPNLIRGSGIQLDLGLDHVE